MHMPIYHALSQTFPVQTKASVSGRLDLDVSYLYKVPKFLEINPFILIYPFIKYCRLFDEGVELRRLSWLLPQPR